MKKLALFSLGETTYALSITIVEHIIAVPEVASLPLMRSGFAGAFLYEGRVLPLFDLWRVFIGDNFSACRESKFAVLCSTEFGLVGFPADQVIRVVDSDRGELISSPSNLKTLAIQQVFVCKGNRYPVLDVEALVASSYR